MKTTHLILGLAIFFAMGWLGTFERADEIIYTMPQSTYDAIKDSLTAHGRTPSDKQIADYYLDMQ